MSHEKSAKSRPDLTCRLCLLPEGNSAFGRIGKRKVQHQNCSQAWSAEDRAKGREHVFLLQIEREESVALLDKDASYAVAKVPGTAA
jgi:hypothetical protein